MILFSGSNDRSSLSDEEKYNSKYLSQSEIDGDLRVISLISGNMKKIILITTLLISFTALGGDGSSGGGPAG